MRTAKSRFKGVEKYRLFKPLLHKTYFDTGFALLNYVKYIYFLVGLQSVLVSEQITGVVLLTFLYAIVCYLTGRYWYKLGLQDTQAEIANRFNPFVYEMREKVTNKTFK